MMQQSSPSNLCRSRDACLGGVCAGIAQRYDLDPIVVRILSLLLAVLTLGFGALAYVALWAAIPQEPATRSPYDVSPEHAESSAYGCVDCSKATLGADEGSGGDSLSIVVWLVIVLCLIVLFAIVVANVSPMVDGSHWWQFWPVAWVILGICLIVLPMSGAHEASWHAVGVIAVSLAVSCLPMSLGVLSWSTFALALQRMWLLVVLAAVLFAVGTYRANGALAITGALLVAVFCLMAIGLHAIPGDVSHLFIYMPGGRAIHIAFASALALI